LSVNPGAWTGDLNQILRPETNKELPNLPQNEKRASPKTAAQLEIGLAWKETQRLDEAGSTRRKLLALGIPNDCL